MSWYGLNFSSRFRLLPLFFLYAVFVSAQDETPHEGQLTRMESGVLESLGRKFPSLRAPNFMLPDTDRVSNETLYFTPKLMKKLQNFGENEPFTPTIKKHNNLATELTKIFLKAENIEILQSLGRYLIQSHVNQPLVIYAMAVTLAHRPDSKNFRIGKLFQMQTSDYVDSRLLGDIIQEAAINGDDRPIDIWNNYTTASNREPEHRVAYFREDLGINLHHWHWHVIYPYQGPDEIVKKDRRGELFYFMHQQIMARYDAERLSNQLPRVKRLNNLKEPIPEAYFSKLDSSVASRSWPSRPSAMTLRDIDRPDDSEKFDIQDLERWANRLYEAIYTKKIIHANGTEAPLDEKTGIDVLGNAVEASPNLSPNIEYYGRLHNDGHNALAFIHDPDGSHLESFSIMGDPATAMRDPVFYRWHSYINEIFLEHKNTLTPYRTDELSYPNILVTDVHVVEDLAPEGEKNHLNTFWDWSVTKLGIGVDFKGSALTKNNISARFTHLNHNSFTYKFTINNVSPNIKTGLVRIFMAPKFDERGVPFPFDEQKKLMMQMDTFRISEIARGVKTYTRNSESSSLTIPFSSSSQRLTVEDFPQEGAYSGCGWPQHMLLPRGNKDGFFMDLFLMVSLEPSSDVQDENGNRPAYTFCGIRDRPYPGRRSMGFPFDRRVDKDITTLADFILPNMATATIKIQFTDAFLDKEPSQNNANSGILTNNVPQQNRAY